jgi:hypothetical protein
MRESLDALEELAVRDGRRGICVVPLPASLSPTAADALMYQ